MPKIHAELYDLVVDPEHRREGIGRALLDVAIARRMACGSPRIVISTAYKNEAAQALFTASGFRRTMVEMTRELSGSGQNESGAKPASAP